MKPCRLGLSTSLALFALPAVAQQYAGLEGFYSSDADGTDVMKTALDFDFRHVDSEHYQGLSLELARFQPLGQALVEDHRLYYRFAGGGDWKWKGRVGSDGHSVVGSASIHDESPRRKEFFIEREIIETPLGLQDGLYSTYLGAAFDLPFDERNVLTTVIGAQTFDGDNLRLHLRGNFIHVLSPELGLSAQLRLRYFHDSHPSESDYYAPRWYAQAMPTLQMRRFVGGWRYAVAAGYGSQREAGTSWRPARMFEASITSPTTRHDWSFQAGFLYTDTPVSNASGSGSGYGYRQFSLSLGRSF
jgi:hypothetical protein